MNKLLFYKNIINALGWQKSTYKKDWYLCPYHHEKTASLHVDFEKGLYHCFGCGQGGLLTKAFYDEKGESAYKYFDVQNLKEPIQKRNTFSNLLDDETLYNDPPDVQLDIKGNLIKASEIKIAQDYVSSRGLPIHVLAKYKMFYAESFKTIDMLNVNKLEKDRITTFTERLVIPIRENGNLVSLEARDVFNNKTNLPKELYRKVLYPKGSSLKTLFNYDKLKFNERLWLVEGLFDLIALQTNPKFINSTCLFGSTISDRQVYLLNQFKEIVYLIDNDQAGKISLDKLASVYKGKLLFAFPPKGCKDVGDILSPKCLGSTIQEQLDKGWLKRLNLKEV